jgi:hypothetical protein
MHTADAFIAKQPYAFKQHAVYPEREVLDVSALAVLMQRCYAIVHDTFGSVADNLVTHASSC